MSKLPTDPKKLVGLSELLGDFGPAISFPGDPGHAPPTNQAQRVIDKFGGVKELVFAMKAAGYSLNLTTVYRWTYPRTPGKRGGGCGGFIPTAAWAAILEAARLAGVIFTPEELDPRRDLVQNTKTPQYIWKMKKQMRERLK